MAAKIAYCRRIQGIVIFNDTKLKRKFWNSKIHHSLNHNHHIAASELILNQDGSIYHLGLLPEQIAPLIITVGDPDRVSKVSCHFDAIEHKVQRREFVTHTGRIGARRVSVVSTGIGTDNIDIVLNE